MTTQGFTKDTAAGASPAPSGHGDCATRRQLTKTEQEETIITNRSGRSTYLDEKSVRRSGATPQAKRQIYREAHFCFGEYLSAQRLEQTVHLYGGLKARATIERKADIRRGGSSLIDLWDVVRFRMIVPDLRSLIELALRISDEFADRLLKCRNYYWRPKTAEARHPYRAIHLQIEIAERMVELQIMTGSQEVLSYLDHAISFKGAVPAISEDHRTWLEITRLGALICDTESLPTDIKSPADLIRRW